VKKCPECGNPSYDGAPVCGNCGYEFPKPKNIAPKSEDIFERKPEVKKDTNEKSVTTILKEKKLLIGAIVLLTIIVICGIVLIGNSNESNSPMQMNELSEYSGGGFSFDYPNTWKTINGTDGDHLGAVFFQNDNNTTIEYYNVTSDSTSLKEINQQRITVAQTNGDYVELVDTVTLDGRNSSNIILENADGNYTRYVSMFSDGELYVFKISGDSINSITAEDIESTIKSADIA